MIKELTEKDWEEIKKHKANDLKIAEWANHIVDIEGPESCEFWGVKYTGESVSRKCYHSNDGDAATLLSVLSNKGYLFTNRSIQHYKKDVGNYVVKYYIMVEDFNSNTITQESGKDTLAEAISTAILHVIEKENQ